VEAAILTLQCTATTGGGAYDDHHVWDIEMGFGDGVKHDGIKVECGERMSVPTLASASAAAEEGGQWIQQI
jgi:hypothetical protein